VRVEAKDLKGFKLVGELLGHVRVDENMCLPHWLSLQIPVIVCVCVCVCVCV
jgi:hypothetical protein